MRNDNTPSLTAWFVAVAILVLGSDEYGISSCPPGSIDAQRRVLLAAGFRKQHLSVWGKQCLRGFLHHVVHRHCLEGLGRRKLYMEHAVRSFLAPTISTATTSNIITTKRQVLIVAAGYDTLAMRLAPDYTHSSVTFWEVDHPATSKRKQKAMEFELTSNGQIHCIMADLATIQLSTILRQQHEHQERPQYDLTSPTIVIVEGLTMYLTGNQIFDFFRDVATVVGPGSRICFDHFGWKNGTFDNGWSTPCQRHFAKRIGEEWHWGIDPNDLQDFLVDTPWTIIDQSAKMGLEYMATVELTKAINSLPAIDGG